MNTSEVLQRFNHYGFFDRTMLYYFLRTGKVGHRKIVRASGSVIRDIPEEELPKLERLLKAHELKHGIDRQSATEMAEKTLQADELADPANPLNKLEHLASPLTSVSFDRLEEQLISTISPKLPKPLFERLESLWQEIVCAMRESLSRARTFQVLLERVRELFEAEDSELLLPNPHSGNLVQVFSSLHPVRRIELEHDRYVAVTTSLGHLLTDYVSICTEEDLAYPGLRAVLGLPPADPSSSLLVVKPRDIFRGGRGRNNARLQIKNKQHTRFGDQDHSLAQSLPESLDRLLYAVAVLQGIGKIRDAVKAGKTRTEVLDDILWLANWLTGASRGDIALPGPGERLWIEAQRGIDSDLRIGRAIPRESIVFTIWEKTRVEARPQVLNADIEYVDNEYRPPYYYPAVGGIKSEIAACGHPRGIAHGVLNLESGVQNAFGTAAKELVCDLVECVDFAALALPEQLLPDGRQAEPPEVSKALAALLDSVTREDESSLLFMCDDHRLLLQCVAHVRCGRELNPDDFAFDYREVSHAGKVRDLRKPIRVIDYQDEAINHEAARKLGAKLPWIGIPLIHDNIVIAVAVFWTTNGLEAGSSSTQWLADRERQAETMGPLIAASIAHIQAQARESEDRTILRELIQRCQQKKPLAEAMEDAAKALASHGFERVRIFRWDPKQEVFIGWVSFGMRSPELFQGLIIDPKENPLAARIRARVTNPSARHYAPGDRDLKDPDGGRLEKDDDLPWVNVPLVGPDERLLGQISCDQGRTRRAILPEDLHFLEIIAAIASLTITSSEHSILTPQPAVSGRVKTGQ